MIEGRIQERKFEQRLDCWYDLYVPRGRRGAPLIIAAHGYGSNKSVMMRLMQRMNDTDFVIASLQAPHQHIVKPTRSGEPLGYGFGWLSNFHPEASIAMHHDAVDRIIDTLVAEDHVDGDRVFLLGFSQSVALNFRYAFTRPERIRAVVAIGGGIPGDWSDGGKYRAGEVKVLYVAGKRDAIYPAAAIQANANHLARLGAAVEVFVFDVDHRVPVDGLPRINRWLLNVAADAQSDAATVVL